MIYSIQSTESVKLQALFSVETLAQPADHSRLPLYNVLEKFIIQHVFGRILVLYLMTND